MMMMKTLLGHTYKMLIDKKRKVRLEDYVFIGHIPFKVESIKSDLLILSQNGRSKFYFIANK